MSEKVLRVPRTKAQARASYDRVSRSYDLFAGAFEKRLRNVALARALSCATCRSRRRGSRVCGIDLSPGMQEVSRRRLERKGLSDSVVLHCGDAAKLPFVAGSFDHVFMSFALELFDTPEIPVVLGEIKRVLKPGGRLGVVSLSRGDGTPLILQLYEWLHRRLPQVIDCRPIYVERALLEAGFRIGHTEIETLWGVPARIVVSDKQI